MNGDTLYLDHAATTPLRPEAREAMAPFLDDRFGNPSSAHGTGRTARLALEEARERIAALLGADPVEILFTAGGTEADNLAVLGRWRADGGGVALSAVEHSAVRRSAARAGVEGAQVTTLAVDERGRLDPAALEEALHEPLSVVSVMWANNEVGTIQPVERVAELCRDRGVVFHTDAVQAVGHVPVSVRDVPCDLLALSAHKFGGPRGVGALYVRNGVALEPLIYGGGQERGFRGGTSNVAGAVGMAAALERAAGDRAREADRLGRLRDRLEARILDAVDGATVNGAGADRLPHVLSVSLRGIPSDVLLPALDLEGVAVSSGSACHSGATSPSHVLVAMGAEGDATIRFSLG
ncbi:MAG: aminotransferase class V-fold PLP-dependent enzyme, partial [Gemmatimonadetes bacterium]|nr:cysteine desulfurase [Gemmatimonadota bacterium]NIQ55900.1 cysteine desulfurase [Gemmatimonadota bacterium]NIU76102.1 aminotransferase class V-fold PLP-dependent enzyme [Gammaproteobacteria bacterium]NIX45650.1 aminotransferase class V-fold PLP-dependent enzyme [Gemmatimonadota bacterium]NIY09951.1 aminotransferase class V-fold PLP-dependent enzyme [Gemmatimonadota bacterium]